jgi:hypothetical protein
MDASEAAAATASVIFGQSRGVDGYRSRSRAGSFSGGYSGSYRSPSPYPAGVPFPGGNGSAYGGNGSTYGDPYAYDESIHGRHRSRSHSRPRHHSSSSRQSPIILNPPPAQYVPGYGSVGSAYGSFGSYGGQPMASPGYAASSVPGYGVPAATSTVLIPAPHRHRHSSSSHHHRHHHRPRSASGYGYGY